MNKLTIYRRYFYNADCFKKAQAMKPAGVQVHSTGANNPWLHRYVQPDDGRIGGNTYNNDHNRPGLTVCAHAYIGRQTDGTVAVYQTLPWNIRCWLSGSGPKGNANKLGYVGFEVCEDKLEDSVYFHNAVIEQAALLTAYLCQEYAIVPADTVRDHRELHSMGLASNHGDITSWLKKFGWTMDGFRYQVETYLADGVEVTYINCDEVKSMYDATATNPGKYLNLRSGKGTDYASICPIPQGATVSVLDDSDPEWCQVTYGGFTGYAMRKYLTPIDPKPPDAGEPEQGEPQEPERPGQDADTVTISRDHLVAIKALLVPFIQDGEALLAQIDEALTKGG